MGTLIPDKVLVRPEWCHVSVLEKLDADYKSTTVSTSKTVAPVTSSPTPWSNKKVQHQPTVGKGKEEAEGKGIGTEPLQSREGGGMYDDVRPGSAVARGPPFTDSVTVDSDP